jgi:tetratricopeptide (TPR) repeat protein
MRDPDRDDGQADEPLTMADHEDGYRTALLAFGPRSEEAIDAGSVLAQALTAAARHNEATDLWTRLTEQITAIEGPEARRTLRARGFVGRSLLDAHRFEEAIDVLGGVLEDRNRLLGPRDAETLTSVGNYARALAFGGRLDEAIFVTRELLADRREILGPDHPSTFDSLGNLAQFLREDGRYEEALDAFREVYELRLATLGEDDPATESSAFNLLIAEGDLDPAGVLDELRDFVVELTAAYGPDDLHVLLVRGHLARLLTAAGQPAEAVEQLEVLVEDRTRVLSRYHPTTFTTRHNLGLALADDGRLADAVAHLGKLLVDARMAFDDESVVAADIAASIAELTGASCDDS